MLDPNVIRENPDSIKKGLSSRGMDPTLVDGFLRADSTWRELTSKLEGLRARKNKLGKDDQEEARKIKKEARELEAQLKPLEEQRDWPTSGPLTEPPDFVTGTGFQTHRYAAMRGDDHPILLVS